MLGLKVCHHAQLWSIFLDDFFQSQMFFHLYNMQFSFCCCHYYIIINFVWKRTSEFTGLSRQNTLNLQQYILRWFLSTELQFKLLLLNMSQHTRGSTLHDSFLSQHLCLPWVFISAPTRHSWLCVWLKCVGGTASCDAYTPPKWNNVFLYNSRIILSLLLDEFPAILVMWYMTHLLCTLLAPLPPPGL